MLSIVLALDTEGCRVNVHKVVECKEAACCGIDNVEKDRRTRRWRRKRERERERKRERVRKKEVSSNYNNG